MMTARFDERRRWFDGDKYDGAEFIRRFPEAGVRYTCPCCGYPTLDSRGHYSICELCHWEDDGQDDFDADRILGGPNGSYSLSEARINFIRYLQMYSPDKDPGVSLDGPVRRNAKQALMEAFDHMVGETDPAVLTALWRQVAAYEQILTNELLREVGGREV